MNADLSPQDKEALNTLISGAGMAFVGSMITDQATFYDARASQYDSQNEVPSRINRRRMLEGIYHSVLKERVPQKN